MSNTRACFSEQMMTNCRSEAEGEDEFTSTDELGDIRAFKLLDED